MLDVPGAGSGSLSSNSGLGHVGQVSSPAPSAASASGAPRILTFNPRKLCFPPPLDRVIENRIILHNPSPTCVAWKFLSATPRRYFVTPIVGFLHPQESVEVSVSYKPRHHKDGDKENPADLIDEHFQVHAKIASLSDEKSYEEVFKRDDGAAPRAKYRIRCVFAPVTNMTPAGSLSRSPHREYSPGVLVPERLQQLRDERTSLEHTLDALHREVVRAKTEESRLRSDVGSITAPTLPLDIPVPLATLIVLLGLFLARVVLHMAEELQGFC